MSKKVTFTYTGNKIEEAIEKVAKTAKTLQQQIHNIAVSTLLEWMDSSASKARGKVKVATDEQAMIAAELAACRLNKLQNASPYHANAFSKWVGHFTNLQWNDGEKKWEAHASASRLKAKTFTEARNKPFWEVSPPKKPKPFIMIADLQRILEKAAKHRQEGKAVEGDLFSAEACAKVTEAVELLKAAGLEPAE